MAHVVVAVNIVGAIDAIQMLVWRVLCALSIPLFQETKNIRRSTNIIPILTTVVLSNFGNYSRRSDSCIRHLTEGVVTKFVTRQFVDSFHAEHYVTLRQPRSRARRGDAGNEVALRPVPNAASFMCRT